MRDDKPISAEPTEFTAEEIAEARVFNRACVWLSEQYGVSTNTVARLIIHAFCDMIDQYPDGGEKAVEYGRMRLYEAFPGLNSAGQEAAQE